MKSIHPAAQRTSKLRFDERKAAQAAARLITLEGGPMNHLKLIKLLYLAERQALLTCGRPITFDSYVSMPHGPVLSFTLDLINLPRDPKGTSYWQELISERQDHEVALLKEKPPTDALSPAEEGILDDVYRVFGQMNQWELRDYSHRELAEWRDPKGSSVGIRIRDILMGEGWSEDEAIEVERDLYDESVFIASFGE